MGFAFFFCEVNPEWFIRSGCLASASELSFSFFLVKFENVIVLTITNLATLESHCVFFVLLRFW
jgi:hypothetical protein